MLIDPKEGDVRFENEGSLEPLPVVRERTVVMRAVGLTKMYPAVSEGSGAGRAALELFRGLDLRFMRERWWRLWGRAARARVPCCICWRRWIRLRRERFGVGRAG